MSLPLIFIVGPTAIGKSNAAINIAKKINGEIINADSMQVYSDLKILTARPTKNDVTKIPHHLYGYVSGNNRYNVANWCEDLMSKIEDNNARKIYSIIVGGTGMYINSFINGLAKVPVIPEYIKVESEKKMQDLGSKKFYEEVYNIDQDASKKISYRDSQRLKRIWEVSKYTKKNLTYWKNKNHKKYLLQNDYKIFLFSPSREKIYQSVNNRFEKMISDGAIEEVRELVKLKLNPSLPIMKAHGVPEISSYISRKITLDECVAKSKQVTRNYVKRQLTWWRSSKLKINKVFGDFPSNINIKKLNI